MRFLPPIPVAGNLMVSNVKKKDVTKSNPLRLDPTRTTLIRRQFMAEIKRRVRKLKIELVDFVVTKDALGLDPRQSITILAQPREFAFQTDANKLSTFNSWFAQQVEASVLSPSPGTAPGQPWTTTYVESAYRRGVLNAYLSTRQMEFDDAGNDIGEMSRDEFMRSAFSAPETMSKVQLLGTRTYEQLKGVTNAMGAEMNRIMAQGIADGLGAADIARNLVASIDSLTRSRAMTIARTELIYAHAEGQLDSFERLGVKEVGVMAEWSTAGDDYVCPLCAVKEGQKYTITEARGLIPLHPNCRCTWIPFIK